MLGKSKKSRDIDTIVVEGQVHPENKLKVTVMNTFLLKLHIKSLVKFPEGTISITVSRVSHILFFGPVHEQEVSNVILSLDTNKSTDNIAPLITDAINLALCPGIYPDCHCLQVARMTCVHKTGYRTNPSNYRPKSVLPIINNILEIVEFKFLRQ